MIETDAEAIVDRLAERAEVVALRAAAGVSDPAREYALARAFLGVADAYAEVDPAGAQLSRELARRFAQVGDRHLAKAWRARTPTTTRVKAAPSPPPPARQPAPGPPLSDWDLVAQPTESEEERASRMHEREQEQNAQLKAIQERGEEQRRAEVERREAEQAESERRAQEAADAASPWWRKRR